MVNSLNYNSNLLTVVYIRLVSMGRIKFMGTGHKEYALLARDEKVSNLRCGRNFRNYCSYFRP